ncbi:MAG: hypothetical protein RL748_1816 [Pseudomonadota bacterium]
MDHMKDSEANLTPNEWQKQTGFKRKSVDPYNVTKNGQPLDPPDGTTTTSTSRTGEMVLRATSPNKTYYVARNSSDAIVTPKNKANLIITWKEIRDTLLKSPTTHLYPLLLRKQRDLKEGLLERNDDGGNALPDHYPECCVECCMLAVVVLNFKHHHAKAYPNDSDLTDAAWEYALRVKLPPVWDDVKKMVKPACEWCRMRGHIDILVDLPRLRLEYQKTKKWNSLSEKK